MNAFLRHLNMTHLESYIKLSARNERYKLQFLS